MARTGKREVRGLQAYVMVEKSEGKRQLGRPACFGEDNIKEYLYFYLYTLRHVKGRHVLSRMAQCIP